MCQGMVALHDVPAWEFFRDVPVLASLCVATFDEQIPIRWIESAFDGFVIAGVHGLHSAHCM